MSRMPPPGALRRAPLNINQHWNTGHLPVWVGFFLEQVGLKPRRTSAAGCRWKIIRTITAVSCLEQVEGRAGTQRTDEQQTCTV